MKKKIYQQPTTEMYYSVMSAPLCESTFSNLDNTGGDGAKKHFHVEQEAHFTFPTSNDGVNGTAFSPWED